jgi:hypothetical protein
LNLQMLLDIRSSKKTNKNKTSIYTVFVMYCF